MRVLTKSKTFNLLRFNNLGNHFCKLTTTRHKTLCIIFIIVFLKITALATYINPKELPSDTMQRKCAINLYKNIKCPVCNGQSIADSGAPMAANMRLWIKAQIQLGRPKEEIIAELEEIYGPDIHLNSLNIIFIYLPFLAIFILILLLWYQRRKKLRECFKSI